MAQIACQKSTSGGKGNAGRFVEREPRICAAGLASAQPNEKVADALQHYLLQDKVDALISDAIIPPEAPPPMPPLRKPQPLDMRHAGGCSQVAALVNPPTKTKFQALLDDVKDTTYASYWKRQLGKAPDPVPLLPQGFDTLGTTFGKKTPYEGSLYDIVMPKIPYPDKTPRLSGPGVQTDRNYCKPPFDPERTYGKRTDVDKRGIFVKCCLTNEKIIMGTDLRDVVTSVEANFLEASRARIGKVLAPNDNIREVPLGHCFGQQNTPTSDSLPECFTMCEINPERKLFLKSLAHLNSLRKCLSKRVLPTFFRDLYLGLKYFDNEKSGWLPKQLVYDYCGSKLIRFDPSLLEPLLSMWQAYDGSCIRYQTFLHIINYREISPELPKIEDGSLPCSHFSTTYKEMVKPGQEVDNRQRAGLPSGRYFDTEYPVTPIGMCKADDISLPQESDVRTCISPSVMTQFNISHRDMYAIREPQVIRKVFEAAGENFTDNTFDAVWKEAQKFHPQQLVCYESFRRALKTSEEKPVVPISISLYG